MSNLKFNYNPKELRYERVEVNLKTGFWKFLKFLMLTIATTLCLYFAFSYFIDSPKEMLLKNEIHLLTEQYDKLNVQLNELDSILLIVRSHDDNIFRVIFEADPIPEAIRMAGFGGVNRYAQMEGYQTSETVISTAKRLDILLTQMYIQSKSFEELAVLAKQKKDMLENMPAIQPVSNKDLKRISSGFGMRNHPILGIRRFHKGMDFATPMNTKIYATGKGVVKEIKRSRRGRGNYIIIDHKFGYETIYAHLSQILVDEGDEVLRGDIIGLAGNTGFSTAPHLHYEVHKDNKAINPVNFYFQDINPDEYEKILELASQDNTPFD